MKISKENSRGSSPRRINLTVDDSFSLAIQLHQRGRSDEAETLYRKILSVAPQHLDTLHFYGVLCHHQQRYEEAVNLIQRIITAVPENADAHNNLGNVLEAMGRLQEAEASYRRAIALNSDHAPALNNLGVVLAARKALEEALEAYGLAVRLSPENADFRYNLGNALRRAGQIHEAVAAYQKAVDLDPANAKAWQGLSRTLAKAGRMDEAARIFKQWLEKDPQNPIALYQQAACLGLEAPDRAPDAFIKKTFDEMAGSFDEHLQEKLDYRAPQLLMEALSESLPPPIGALDILDAGCGTGLCGPLLRPYARKLVGVDLSPEMLIRAGTRKIYDELVLAELTEFLNDQNGTFDLILSADTLCYFGALELILAGAVKALKPDGVLAFTLEDAGDATDKWQLNRNGRYAHGQNYVIQILKNTGFAVTRIDSAMLRKEGGEPVWGHLVAATVQG